MQARPARSSAGWCEGTGRRDSCEQGQPQLQANQLGFLMPVLQGANMNLSSHELLASGAARRDTSACQFLLGFSPVCPGHYSSLCPQAGPWLSQPRLRQCCSCRFPTLTLLVLLHGLALPGGPAEPRLQPAGHTDRQHLHL